MGQINNYIKDRLTLLFNLIIQGKYQEALSQLDNIILKAFPHNLDLICYRSDILLQSLTLFIIRVFKRFQEAILGYNQCIQYNQNYIHAYTKKAETLLQQKLSERIRNLEQQYEALEIYDLLLQDDPTNYKTLYEKGIVNFHFRLYYLNQKKMRFVKFKIYVILRKQNQFKNTMFEMKEYDRANQLFDQVLVLSPQNLDVQTKQGDILELKINKFLYQRLVYLRILQKFMKRFFQSNQITFLLSGEKVSLQQYSQNYKSQEVYRNLMNHQFGMTRLYSREKCIHMPIIIKLGYALQLLNYLIIIIQQLDRHEEAINNFLTALSIFPELELSKEALQISKQRLKVQK